MRSYKGGVDKLAREKAKVKKLRAELAECRKALVAERERRSEGHVCPPDEPCLRCDVEYLDSLREEQLPVCCVCKLETIPSEMAGNDLCLACYDGMQEEEKMEEDLW